MKTKTLFLLGGMAALVALSAGQANAQDRSKTPKNWDYEIVDGKRVPKAKRQVNDDGSWREERRTGDCVEVKERSASGEIKITRTCDNKPD
ncbi:hypothetical protein [Sphingomicrobium clamense]|uniref:DUF5666 domain-containing protein n=1 Tax=Sphingomicrobium clamense TaxID=2851013 RepID=A0ABS6V2G0_9SPHN|nr:hypothetical protein [Sphingomicrobium sp. B8]MBW0143748.1 hypothetical protein [Sphingomicrobium sp. B8]